MPVTSKIKKRYLYLLSVISGLILAFAWPANGFPLLLFIGFIPLLFVENIIFSNKEGFSKVSFFGYAIIAMFVWNLLTTYWICYSTVVGAALAVLFNTLFMAITLSIFHYTHRVLKHISAYLAFILYWLTFEFLHLNWDLTWSWMNLGNGFANYPSWIQWYEYTGGFGGTLWILLANYIGFSAVKLYINKQRTLKVILIYTAGWVALILAPIIVSLIIYYNYTEKGNPVNVAVVQPNIDPYNEKYETGTEEQISRFIRLAKTQTDAKTQLLVGPETAIPEGVWENSMEEYASIDSLRLLIKQFPQLNIITGMSSYKMFEKGQTPSPTARLYFDGHSRYDSYNTALMLDTSSIIQLYHKSKLVPGVEKMPFSRHLGFLEKYALDLGGIVGSLGIQNERTVFYSSNKNIKAAPVICYESVYGEYVATYVKNGANIICIITNDGWWEDTPGYRQHFSYARLRAVETRRSVVQSANTGISGFINQRGDVLQKTGWWHETAIKQELLMNETNTFYGNYGDYIARAAAYMGGLIFIYTVFLSILRKIRKQGNR